MATSFVSDRARDLFAVGLRNARALENQALSIMTPQVARLEHYPELADRLRDHIGETNAQIARLDTLLGDLGTGSSMFKDFAMSMAGTMAAMGNSLAGDEVLKNSLANFAFENLEIASYRSLLALAEFAGADNAMAPLRQSLEEEERMAQWLAEHLTTITMRYARLYTEGGSLNAKA